MEIFDITACHPCELAFEILAFSWVRKPTAGIDTIATTRDEPHINYLWVNKLNKNWNRRIKSGPLRQDFKILLYGRRLIPKVDD